MSRQGDRLTVSNDDERLPSSSRDVELATAGDPAAVTHPKSSDDGQGEGQENPKNDKTGSHVTCTELCSNDADKVSIERPEVNELATDGPPTELAARVEETNQNLMMKERQNSDNNVCNVVSYAEEVVAQLHIEIEKCSTGEALVDEKNTIPNNIKSANPSVDEGETTLACYQVDQLVSVNVTESTLSSIRSTCVIA